MTDVELKLTADMDQATKEVAGFRKEYAAMVQAVEKPLRQINALQKTQQTAKAAAADFYAARQRVGQLQEALTKVRGPSDTLARSLGGAKAQADAMAGAIERQKKSIDGQRLAVEKARAAYTALKASMADGGTSRASVDGARQGLADQISLLRRQQAALREQRSELAAASRSVKELQVAYDQAAQPVRLIERDLRGAERALARATVEFDRQKAKVREQRAELQAAGVDTRNLAAEQQRLQGELAIGMGAGRNDQAIRAAAQNLGVERYRALHGELDRLRGQYQLLRSSGNLTTRELAVAQQTLTQRVRETQQALKGVNAEQQRSRLSGGAASLAAQFGGAYGALRGLQGVVRIVDGWTELSDRIKLASGSQQEYEQGMERLRDISDRTFTAMRGNAETFVNSLSPLRERGFSNPEILNFVEAVGLGMVASAAKGERAASVMQQFSNALQDGKLQGDAFQTMVRNTPVLTDALAASLGRTREELAKMAREGQLTTDVWVPAVIAQLDNLGTAVDGMNITVGDALTRLNNAWEDAIGKADTKPLVQAIQELTETVGDPLIVENLVKIASAMVYLASVAVSTASGFATLGDNIGYAAAKASGNVDKLTKLEKTLKEVNNAITGDSFIGSNTVAVLMKQFDPEGLVRWRKELEEEIAKVGAELSGMSLEAYRAQQEAARRQREAERLALEERRQIEQQDLAARRVYAEEVNGVTKEMVVKFENALADQTAAQRKANSALSKAQAEQLSTQKRYKEALAKLNAGAAGPASYGGAQALQVAARQALSAKDADTAKRHAQAALEMLMKLAEAGENTYGFQGMVKQLQEIEQQADQINLTKAQADFEAAREKTREWKKELEALKNFTIAPNISDEALATATDKLRKWAEMIGLDIAIAPRILPGEGKLQSPSSALAAGLTAPVTQLITPLQPTKPATPVPVEVKPIGIRQDGTNSFTNLPPVSVDVKPAGIRQDGDNSFTNLPAVPVEVVPKGIRQDGENSFTNLPPVDVELQIDQQAASRAQQHISELAQQLRRELVIPITPVAGAAGASPAEQIDGHAAGGLIRGPGTGTSDSILARLSNGEFVMRADAVRHYGTALLQRLNSRQLPRFADGGPVSSALVPHVPNMAQVIEAKATARQGFDLADYGWLGLNLGGSAHEVIVHKSTENELRLAARKFGRPGRGR